MSNFNPKPFPLESFFGRSQAEAISPVAGLLDILFPPVLYSMDDGSYFKSEAKPRSAPQIVYEFRGQKYVLHRIGSAHTMVRGTYNPDKEPTGVDRFGYDKVDNADGINFDISRELVKEAGKKREEFTPEKIVLARAATLFLDATLDPNSTKM